MRKPEAAASGFLLVEDGVLTAASLLLELLHDLHHLLAPRLLAGVHLLSDLGDRLRERLDALDDGRIDSLARRDSSADDVRQRGPVDRLERPDGSWLAHGILLGPSPRLPAPIDAR